MASTGADKIGEDAQVNPESITKNELPDRTDVPDEAGANGELSKNAAKKAAKRDKQAADKASKSKDKPIGTAEAKLPTSKAAKKKIEDTPLIAIDVAKEDDFSGWYQQVLTKGDMLDYYDVSGCYILKVSRALVDVFTLLTFTACLLLHMGASTRMVQYPDQENGCQELRVPTVRLRRRPQQGKSTY